NRRAPAVPPARLATEVAIKRLRSRGSSRRYAMALATLAGHSAIELVALAEMGAIPAKSRAGNEMKLPPPAIELRAPPSTGGRRSRASISGGRCARAPCPDRARPPTARPPALRRHFQSGW